MPLIMIPEHLGQPMILVQSKDVVSGSDIMPCIKIYKPLVVYLLMTSITTLRA